MKQGASLRHQCIAQLANMAVLACGVARRQFGFTKSWPHPKTASTHFKSLHAAHLAAFCQLSQRMSWQPVSGLSTLGVADNNDDDPLVMNAPSHAPSHGDCADGYVLEGTTREQPAGPCTSERLQGTIAHICNVP